MADGSTGEYSVYAKLAQFEIMFHVAPLLPHQPDDVQQVERKRHLGNDVVVSHLALLRTSVRWSFCCSTRFCSLRVVGGVYASGSAFVRCAHIDVALQQRVPVRAAGDERRIRDCVCDTRRTATSASAFRPYVASLWLARRGPSSISLSISRTLARYLSLVG